ncbi:unnamed protein product [Cuscuta campestris]|uniref:Uncharacterized protein n=1 Tax=Cuscuta campestris TaxID=132261 RepID=A0A484MBN6_9ASTE|nr:unnamed protein product [Cuscuta campestris]
MPYGGSYYSLGDFKIDNDGAASFLENKFIQEVSGEDVQAPIRVALNIVDLFWHVAPGKQDPPIEVTNFRELCSLALKKTDEMSIRKLCYYIFKNLIVFDRGDELCFLLKMWNLYMMDEGNAKASKQHFGDFTKATELSDYIMRIEPEDQELVCLRRFDAPGRSEKDLLNIPINERYEKADSVIAFIMDAIRHF